LKFITTPAVLVEAGMLSNQTEGRKLQSPGYHEAIATCIANGVANFFNGIVINP
jgi:N-acetylmuramoyl-L-alanine amidase